MSRYLCCGLGPNCFGFGLGAWAAGGSFLILGSSTLGGEGSGFGGGGGGGVDSTLTGNGSALTSALGLIDGGSGWLGLLGRRIFLRLPTPDELGEARSSYAGAGDTRGSCLGDGATMEEGACECGPPKF